MADFKETLMGIWTEGVKLVNSAAKNVAGTTRYKLDELDNVSRRREAITELGEKVYELYRAGVEMPEEIQPLLAEMRTLDENLDKMRTDHAEQKKVIADQRAQARAEAKQKRAAAKQVCVEDEYEVADEEATEAEDVIDEITVEEPVAEAIVEEEKARQDTENV